MATILVGIGEVGVSTNPDDIIKTMALGSCLAVIFLARKPRMVGLAHVALPDSSIGSSRSESLPGYFADKAVPYLISTFKKSGIFGPPKLTIKLAGGATIMDPNGVFNIGKRNILAVRKVLWKNRLGAIVEDLGNNFSRTVSVEVGSGKVFVSSPEKGVWEI